MGRLERIHFEGLKWTKDRDSGGGYGLAGRVAC